MKQCSFTRTRRPTSCEWLKMTRHPRLRHATYIYPLCISTSLPYSSPLGFVVRVERGNGSQALCHFPHEGVLHSGQSSVRQGICCLVSAAD